ncbi:MAG TPA: hypothetical protein VFA26_02755 [Gemmataceae bacterium]|nr:hypothetical protein [Gemmataceae bacterium]
MRLLVVRGDLQSSSGYSAAARDYTTALAGRFDRVVGVDLHFSPARPFQPFPHSLVSDAEARSLAGRADFALALSLTTPDGYARYPGAVNVGLTFWETDRLPPGWAEQARPMDAVWAPSTHTRAVFEAEGVPAAVVPWPVRAPIPRGPGLPDGEVHDLDRRSWLPGGTRINSCGIAESEQHAILCVAQDVPRKALLLLLAEWLEFKRLPEAAPWRLILKTAPADPATPQRRFVEHFRRHVQALRRQLGVRRADVLLWAGRLGESDFDRLLAGCFAVVVPSLGEGFCGPAVQAILLGKPLLAPRHTALADYLPADHPYTYASRPAILRFVRDPLGIYPPSSTWHVPAPHAIAKGLIRLVTDAPAERAAACHRARERCQRWCDVGPLLAEVTRLQSRRLRLSV